MNRKPIILALIAVAAVAIVGYAYSTMRSMHNGKMPMGAMHGGGKALAVVTVPELSAKAELGRALFNDNCSACHGKNAAGQEGVAPPLIHKIYEPNHHGDIAFQRAAKLGVRAHHWPFGNMPPVKGITEAEVGKVIAYVRELQRANGIQ